MASADRRSRRLAGLPPDNEIKTTTSTEYLEQKSTVYYEPPTAPFVVPEDDVGESSDFEDGVSLLFILMISIGVISMMIGSS